MPDEPKHHGQHSKGLVILIDDDKLPMEMYVKTLEMRGFDVRQYYDSDSFFAFLDEEEPDIAAIILDILMPVDVDGRFAREDTDEGLRTGYFVYRDLRAMERYATVPIVVLTNTSYKRTISLFPDEPHLEKWQKLNCPPSKLVGLITEMIQRKKDETESPTSHEREQE